MLALVCSAARAQTSVHATGEASAAYTDNAFAAAEDAPEPEVETFFFMLTPGALLLHEGPAARYRVAYQRHYTFFLEAPDRDDASDTALAEARYSLSPIQTLTLGLYLTHSSFAGLFLDTVRPGAREARVGYEVERLRADFLQSYAHQLSPSWTFLQSSVFGVLLPIDGQEFEPLRYRLGGELGAEYVAQQDAYAALAGVTYFRTEALSSELTTPEEDAVLLSARGRWRRNLSLRWSSEVSAGLGLALAHDDHALDGLGGAALYFAEQAWNAKLHYTHSQTSSLETFDVLVIDQVGLELGGSPSARRLVQLSCLSSLAHHRELLTDAAAESVNVWLSEAQVQWLPNWFSLALRYQYLRQFDSSGGERLPNLSRHLVMLTAAAMFPERRVQPVPVAPPSRVDTESAESPAAQ